jgi:hypothetical protein
MKDEMVKDQQPASSKFENRGRGADEETGGM